MRSLFCFFIFITIGITVKASVKDSLLNEIEKTPENKAVIKSELYCLLFRKLNNENYEQAEDAARKAVKYAVASGIDSLIAKRYLQLAILYESSGKIESAFRVLDSAKQSFDLFNHHPLGYYAQRTYSTLYRRKANYKKALEHGLTALQIAEDKNFNEQIASANTNVGVIYMTIHDYTRAEEYHNKALQSAQKMSDTLMLSTAYSNLGILNRELADYDKALEYYFNSLQLELALNDSGKIAFVYNDIGAAYSKKGEIANAENYLKKSIQIRERINELNEIAYTYNYLGENYERRKDLTAAEFYIKKSLTTAQQIGNNKQTYEAYESLSDFYARNKKYDSAYSYAILFKNFRDSIAIVNNEKALSELTTRYETEKKEQKIKEQELALKNRNYLLIAAIVVFVLMILLAVGIYRRRKLLEEAHLQKEIAHQEELAAKAVIQAEENERKRIAADLHDSVGQMMSAAKMNLSLAASEIQYTTEEQRTAMEKVMAMIDESCKEVRVVSHNLMPNALLKSGLGNAITGFINKIDRNIIKINLYTEGLDKKIDENVELVLYRVIQECVNNVIKHADANRLDISLIKDDDGISITLEDNGKGFDVKKLKESKGIGLKNIQSRIEYLKGTVEWDSALGKGTVVSIHV